jgi:hypothetical protein
VCVLGPRTAVPLRRRGRRVLDCPPSSAQASPVSEVAAEEADEKDGRRNLPSAFPDPAHTALRFAPGAGAVRCKGRGAGPAICALEPVVPCTRTGDLARPGLKLGNPAANGPWAGGRARQRNFRRKCVSSRSVQDGARDGHGRGAHPPPAVSIIGGWPAPSCARAAARSIPRTSKGLGRVHTGRSRPSELPSAAALLRWLGEYEAPLITRDPSAVVRLHPVGLRWLVRH